MPNKDNLPTYTSTYLAYHSDPKKPQGRSVKLSTEAKRRYEAMGWTFRRVRASLDYTF